jgi:AbrB family looped-hinge helix DNA binding protein
METTKLSTKGQVIIPKSVRNAHRWKAGQELVVFDSEDGVLLKTKKPFKETAVIDVAGSLAYKAKPKSLKEMEVGIRKGIRDNWRDRG